VIHTVIDTAANMGDDNEAQLLLQGKEADLDVDVGSQCIHKRFEDGSTRCM
jgi:hypothetical protein